EIRFRDAPALAALNETLRDDYIADCQKGIDRWNRTLSEVGVLLRLPHHGFNRNVGVFSDHSVTPNGRLVTAEEWESGRAEWLPTAADQEHVASLMRAVTEPGKMAGWIAPPASGIHNKPVDYEYVRAD